MWSHSLTVFKTFKVSYKNYQWFYHKDTMAYQIWFVLNMALIALNSFAFCDANALCTYHNIPDCQISNGLAICESDNFTETVASVPSCTTRFHFTTLPVSIITFTTANFSHLTNLRLFGESGWMIISLNHGQITHKPVSSLSGLINLQILRFKVSTFGCPIGWPHAKEPLKNCRFSTFPGHWI